MNGIVQNLGVGYILGSSGVSQEDSEEAPTSDYEAFNVTDNAGEPFNATDGGFNVLS